MTGPGAGSDAGGAACVGSDAGGAACVGSDVELLVLLKNKKQNPQYMYMQLDKDI